MKVSSPVDMILIEEKNTDVLNTLVALFEKELVKKPKNGKYYEVLITFQDMFPKDVVGKSMFDDIVKMYIKSGWSKKSSILSKYDVPAAVLKLYRDEE